MAESEDQETGRRNGEMQESSAGSGANQSNNEDAGNASERDFRDKHGNQTLRQPSGGDGSGESRGDGSAYNPAPATGQGSQATRDADPVEGSRDEYGSAGETQR